MIIVDGITVDEEIGKKMFSCDLSLCKGSCCTLKGGSGAPLADEEVAEIERAFPLIEHYLPQAHRDTIAQDGLVELTREHYSTVCHDRGACVFVFYEDGIARCAFERGADEGLLKWRKPLSCHLFPIRMHPTSIHYEYLSECDPALDRGIRDDVPLARFLHNALTRAFGKSWYDRFLDLSTQL
jgi:hypothetical protein